MFIKRSWLALAIVLPLVLGQDDFAHTALELRYFGSPDRVYFLPRQKALLVDSKGFGLIGTANGQLHYVVSERVRSSGIINNQLVVFNAEQKKVYVMDPDTGLLVSDKKLKSLDFFDMIIKNEAIYYIFENRITKENSDEEIRMDFEGKRIIRAFFADHPTPRLHALVEESDIRSVCLYNIDSDLHKLERKNCSLIAAESGKQEKVVDAYHTSKGIVVIHNGYFYTEAQQKVKFSSDGPGSSSRMLKGSFEEFLKSVKLGPEAAESMPLRPAKGLCVASTDPATKGLIKELCSHELGSKVTVHWASGVDYDISLINIKEAIDDFFIDNERQRLIVKTVYDTLVGVNLEEKRQIWKRDEGLGNLATVLFVQNPYDNQSSDFVRQYEMYLSQGQIVKAWHLRVDQGLRDFFKWIDELRLKLVQTLSTATNGDFKGLLSRLGISGSDSEAPRAFDFEMKTSKTAIFVSKSGKLFAYNLETMSFVAQRALDHPIRLEPKERVLPKTTHTGKLLNCEVSKHDHYHLLVQCGEAEAKFLLNNRLEATAYASKAHSMHAPKYTFKYNEGTNELAGFHLETQIWNMRLPSGHEVVTLQRIQDLKIPKVAYVIENKNVLYRVIDPNNVLLVTKGPQGHSISVLNVKFGKTLFEISNDKIADDRKLNFLVDDGSFFVNYFNKETFENELLHIEVFRKKVENDFVQIIKAQFSGNDKVLSEIDYSLGVPEYIVLHKRYALPFNIKAFIAFDSKTDLTSKNLLVVTEAEQVYSLPRSLISTRRVFESEKPKVEEQLGKPNKAKIPVANYFKSTTLPSYDYYLPLDHKRFVTKNLIVAGAEKIWVEPSNFESTSLVVCGGKEIFIAAHSPDNKFDQLPEDFSKSRLWALGVLFVVAIGVTNHLVQSKRPKDKYLASL